MCFHGGLPYCHCESIVFGNDPTILAPRGMLGEAALSIKPLKKRLFLLCCPGHGIFQGVRWHASTPLSKRRDSGRLFHAHKHYVAKNIPAQAEIASRRRPSRHIAAISLEAFSRVKNLHFVIDVLGVKLNTSHINLSVRWKIADYAKPNESWPTSWPSSWSSPWKAVNHRRSGSGIFTPRTSGFANPRKLRPCDCGVMGPRVPGAHLNEHAMARP